MARQRVLTVHDLYPVPPAFDSRFLTTRFAQIYRNCQQRMFPFLSTCFRFMVRDYLIVVPLDLLASMAFACIPYLGSYFITLYESMETVPSWKLYAIALSIFAAELFPGFMQHIAYMRLFHASARIRTGLMGAIYEKTMRLSPSLLKKYMSSGTAINMMSVDVQWIQDYAVMASALFIIPADLVFNSVVLFKTVGIAALAGYAVTGLYLALQFLLTYLATVNQKVLVSFHAIIIFYRV